MFYTANERPFRHGDAPGPRRVHDWMTALGTEATELVDSLARLATRAIDATAAVVLLGSDAARLATPGRPFSPPVAVPLRSHSLGLSLGCLCVDAPASAPWTTLEQDKLHVLADLFVAEVESRFRRHGRPPAAPPEESVAEPGSAAGHDHRPGTILLVEDEEPVRKLVLKVLEGAGYQVLSAASAEEGRRLAEAHDGPLDLLLTDVLLPGMDGPTLARTLTATRPGLRIIFMSGYVGESFDEEAIRAAEDFIPKPFSLRSMLEAVKRVLALS